MTGGGGSRRKGAREELAIVRLLQGCGFAAEKISRAGYSGADVSVPLLGRDRIIEVKVRSRGLSQIYSWLEQRDLLIVRVTRREPLVVLPFKFAAEIAAAAERGK